MVFNPAAHAPSPPSDLMNGETSARTAACRSRSDELGIPDKARERLTTREFAQLDAADWLGSIPNFQRAIKSFSDVLTEAYSGLGGAELSMQELGQCGSGISQVYRTESWHVCPAALWAERDSLPPESVCRRAEATNRDGIELDPADAHGPLFTWLGCCTAMGSLPEAERTAHEAILSTNRLSQILTSSSRRFISCSATPQRRSRI